jgi:hypothetical protein
MGPLVIFEEATAVPPSSSLVLGRLRRPPFPGPVVVDRKTAIGRVVSHELDVGVLVDVWVRMKFSRDQVVQLSCIRRVRKSQAGDGCIDTTACGRNWRRVRLGILCVPLSRNE